ncbi:glycoside hydrolase family 95-like protein [Streptomyces inhibens]|uniref:glycosyl hydrolase family 95 catalytic domain-containing protein n=1 Tax=Streptomyces inhibens TaxID=2293571 RepID=UPI0036A32AA3
MTDPSRRAFTGAALAGTAGAWFAGPGAAWATGGAGRPDPYTSAVRAAAMRWRTLPTGWQQAPFLADGRLGCQIYAGTTPHTLKVMVSHTEVQDQRGRWRAGIGYSRLPVGYFTFTLAGAVTGIDWTLDLWDAELRGTVTTTRGSVRLSALVHTTRSALLISTRPSPGEADAAWSFTWLTAATTRTSGKPADYTPNPAPRTGTTGAPDATHFVEQPLLAGGGWTTAWRERRAGTARLLAAHLVYRSPGDPARTTQEAVRAVAGTLAADPDRLVAGHRAWWHTYHRRSLLSVPDKRLQSFFLGQLYKLGSATRADGPALSEWGPWFPEVGNNWTALWWNLNVQIASTAYLGTNHLELDSVTGAFRRFKENLPLSVPPAYRDGRTYALGHPSDWHLRPGEWTVGVPGSDRISDNFGNLTWGLHNVWLAHRHTMDRAVLRDVLLPLLAGALNFYDHFLYEGSDGHLHLPTTRSPEYADAADCSYDLALIRWAARTLLDAARTLRIEDPRAPRWHEIATRLVPYAQDPADGVMIGAGVPLAESHRHHSHLLWLYPLREKVWDRPADRELMRKSFAHWAGMQSAWRGYSYPVSSSMSSVMGEPERALDLLTFFTGRNTVADCQLTENTMYREGKNFALESPLAAVQSMLDMVLQSHGGVLKVFPSVSRRWPDVSFATLRAQGAFLVDADRSAGRTRWIRVHSEAGTPLVLEHGIEGAVTVRDERGRPLPWKPAGQGRIAVRLPRGATAFIAPPGTDPDSGPRDVPASGPTRPWGLP